MTQICGGILILPETVAPDDYFTFTIDFHNLSEQTAADISSYDLTFWVDGKQSRRNAAPYGY